MNEKQLARLRKIMARKPRPNYSEAAREMETTPSTIRANVIIYGIIPIEER